MSDSYQAIFDAVRSRISNGDVGSAVESAARDAFGNASHQISCVAQEFSATAHEQQRPAAIFRPAIFVDGDQWCALYGEDLQNGVAGFGSTPETAMRDFDKQWLNEKPKEASNAG